MWSINPIVEMKRLYEFIGKPFSDRARAAMQAHRESDDHQADAHRYRLADYGLSEQRIDALFAAYIERHDLRPVR